MFNNFYAICGYWKPSIRKPLQFSKKNSFGNTYLDISPLRFLCIIALTQLLSPLLPIR